MAYFQRYYLHQTLFQAHPAKIEHIQNASLFLAMKVSEILQHSDQFCQILQLDPAKADLAANELAIVTELNF